MTTKEAILKQIEDLDFDMAATRSKIKELNSAITKTETDLIGMKLIKNDLLDKLRLISERTVDYNPTERQVDIARFKAVLPELLRKA